MKKSKRQKHIRLLEKLLERLSTSTDTSAEENMGWVDDHISILRDLEKESGLTKNQMMMANNIWQRHASDFLKQ